MKVYVEDISEEYGDHGISVYSLVRGMTAYTAEVRASDITVLDSDGIELEYDDPLYQTLANAAYEFKRKEVA